MTKQQITSRGGIPRKPNRRLSLVAAFLCLGMLGAASAEAQTTADKAAVLQKCVDLPQLQQFFPKNADGSFKQLVVMQHGVSFPADLGVIHGSEGLAYKDKGQIASDGDAAYFYFHTFEISSNSARVECVFNRQQNGNAPMMQVVTLALQKTGNAWHVSNSTIEAR